MDRLIIGTVGLGSGVYDRLKEVGTGNTRLMSFNGGAAARDKANHVNAITESWWKMREWFIGGEADIVDDGALIGQVSNGLAMRFAPTRGRANLRWIE